MFTKLCQFILILRISHTTVVNKFKGNENPKCTYLIYCIRPFYFRNICLHNQWANLRLGDFFLFITGICSCMNFVEIRQKRVTWLKIESLDPPEDIRLSQGTETNSGQEDNVFHSLRWSAAGACFTTLRDKWKHLIFVLWFHFTFSLLSCF